MAIYESDAPDYVTVLLNSNGFDDLSTRTDYLKALHDADMRIADRAASLRDQMAEHTHQVADLKQQSDAQAQQLSADKASFLASEQAANRGAAAVAAARSGSQAALSDAQGQVASLEQQQAAQRAAVGTGAGAPAYLGGPYSIPTYIVICESGGNYQALNASSGAGGAYQILPSTWRAYGGPGRTAGRAQGRAGPDRRGDLARLRAERLVLRLGQESLEHRSAAGDRLQLLRPHQDMEEVVVEGGDAALLHLHPRAGRQGDGA